MEPFFNSAQHKLRGVRLRITHFVSAKRAIDTLSAGNHNVSVAGVGQGISRLEIAISNIFQNGVAIWRQPFARGARS